MLDEVNAVYSAEVVDRLRSAKEPVTHDYINHEGAIPLPATLTIELGRHMSACGRTGVQVRLYSDLRLKSRKDGGLRDEFEADALRRQREDPHHPLCRF